MCAEKAEAESGPPALEARGALQAAAASDAARADPGDLPHAVFDGRKLGLWWKYRSWQVRLCNDNHASCVRKTCSTGLNTEQAKPFWVCYIGSYGRHCYCQHLQAALKK